MKVLEANPPEDLIELHLDGSWTLPGKKVERDEKPAISSLSIDVPCSPAGSTNSGTYVNEQV